VQHMEGPLCHQDALSEYFNVDVLWGFAIGTMADIRERVAQRLARGNICWRGYPSSFDDDGDV